MKGEDGCPNVRYFIEVVEDSEETFGKDTANRFKYLKEYATLAFSKIKMNSLCQLIYGKTTTVENFRKGYELIQEIVSELQFSDTDYFKKNYKARKIYNA